MELQANNTAAPVSDNQGVPAPGAAPSPSSPVDAPGGRPFDRAHLLVRAGPFAVFALLAEASLALRYPLPLLPMALSLGFLALTAAEFALPWRRLPAWCSILVPLTYAGSVLTLSLAAGDNSGLGVVAFIPVLWTALYHRRWESTVVVVALGAVEVVVMITQGATDAVTLRRVLLWGFLAVMASVAIHGLRDRIREWQVRNARLQDQLREHAVLDDRSRIAEDLREQVIQKVFGATLSLYGAVPQTATAEVRDRIHQTITDLDQAIQLLRDAVFELDGPTGLFDLRREVVALSNGLSPLPALTFTGRLRPDVSRAERRGLMGLLTSALEAMGTVATTRTLEVETGEAGVHVAVRGERRPSSPGQLDERAQAVTELRQAAARAGARCEISFPVPEIQLWWPAAPKEAAPGTPEAGKAGPSRTTGNGDRPPAARPTDVTI